MTAVEHEAVQHESEIAGTTIFDGDQARKGYALNKMCFSFNEAANREAFLRRRGRLLRPLRPNAAAARGDPRAATCWS